MKHEARRRAARERRRRRRLAALATVVLACAGAATAVVVTRRSSPQKVARPRPAATTAATRTTVVPITVPTVTHQKPKPRRVVPQPTLPPMTLPSTAFTPLFRRYQGTEMNTYPTTRRVVLLTFDGGANADGAPSILKTLSRFGVPATFFLTGRWAELYPDLARAIVRRYPIANHTYDHSQLTGLSTAAVTREITRAQTLIRQVTGRDPIPAFRFPYGATDPRLIGIANQLGYLSVRWSVDTLGWQGTALHRSAASVVQRVLAGLQPGEIVLMHLGSPPDRSTLDADALPTIIREVEKRGYTFLALPVA
jgi:peptidoglycan/xylan/chitin deacetylase (PgdA/CDA1 family)